MMKYLVFDPDELENTNAWFVGDYKELLECLNDGSFHGNEQVYSVSLFFTVKKHEGYYLEEAQCKK